MQNNQKLNTKFFDEEMKKIFDQFGRSKFSDHKQLLIYGVCKWLSDEMFVRIVDDVVGNCKYIPTVNDFTERIAKNREHTVAAEKRIVAAQNKKFFKPDDFTKAFKNISQSLQTGNWEAIETMCQKLDKAPLAKCKMCSDFGLMYAFQKNDTRGTVFLCTCPTGDMRAEAIPKWGHAAITDGYKTKHEWEKLSKIKKKGMGNNE